MLPRIAHDQLRPGNYKFEHTQAFLAYPAAFENAAQSIAKGMYGKAFKKPAKGPTTDDQAKNATKPAVSNPWLKGTTKSPSPDEWGKKGGRWIERASSQVEPSWEYQRPVGYQDNQWREECQPKGGKWSPSWAVKGWVDYRADKGYGYGW